MAKASKKYIVKDRVRIKKVWYVKGDPVSLSKKEADTYISLNKVESNK